jgi:hypothetical protein
MGVKRIAEFPDYNPRWPGQELLWRACREGGLKFDSSAFVRVAKSGGIHKDKQELCMHLVRKQMLFEDGCRQ